MCIRDRCLPSLPRELSQEFSRIPPPRARWGGMRDESLRESAGEASVYHMHENSASWNGMAAMVLDLHV